MKERVPAATTPTEPLIALYSSEISRARTFDSR